MDLLDKDIATTLVNKKRLVENKNLLFWYQKSYQQFFKDIEHMERLSILEIGSGTSPIQQFYPQIKTSDIMKLDYVDYQFDALEIDTCNELEGLSFDIITFSNVLHHLRKPLDFLERCEKKLKPGGKLIFLEPDYSLLSNLVYKFHHEVTDFGIKKPEIEHIEGPLSTSNMALPCLIFFKNHNWRATVEQKYEIGKPFYFTSLSYFLTGGISHKFPVPHFLYKGIFAVDFFLTRLLPKLFSSFFILELKKK